MQNEQLAHNYICTTSDGEDGRLVSRRAYVLVIIYFINKVLRLELTINARRPAHTLVVAAVPHENFVNSYKTLLEFLARDRGTAVTYSNLL